MINYANGFSCAVSDNKKEFLINFLQTAPKINEVGEITGLAQEAVATFAMTTETMFALRNSLNEIIENAGLVEVQQTEMHD